MLSFKESYKVKTVKDNMSVSRIAKAYAVDIDCLVSVNRQQHAGITTSSKLKKMTLVALPSFAECYNFTTTEENMTIRSLAKKFAIDVDILIAWNEQFPKLT